MIPDAILHLASTPASSTLNTADWLVLGGYFVLLVALGVWSNMRPVRNAEDYFLGGRSMPVWAVAFSILSTAQSAGTYVGVPANSYGGNLTYIIGNVGAVIGAFVLAWVFIPAYYRLNATTPYEMLEQRFGPTGRLATAWAYLIGRVFASGARIFVAAVPTSIVIVGTVDASVMAWSILGFTILGIALSLFGGVRSVIWIDILQVGVYLGAAIVTIIVLLNVIPVGLPDLIAALQSSPPLPNGTVVGNKLTVVDISTDPSAPFTIFTAMTGFVLLAIASHGVDQDLVQRMLSCKSAVQGARSVLIGVIIGVPAVMIFLILGLLLSVYFTRPDIMGAAAPGFAPQRSDTAFTEFALSPAVAGWGLGGLVVAGLFACGPAGINSGLSAMSSTFVNDIYRPARSRRLARTGNDSPRTAADDAREVRVGRIGVIGAGVALGLMALLCIAWYDPSNRSIIDFVLAVMNFAYAGLVGIFFAALFTRRGTGGTVIAALITGFIITLLFQTPMWTGIAHLFPSLVGMSTQAEVAQAIASTRGFIEKSLTIGGWPWLRLAFPWQLCIAAGASFLVCISLPSPTRLAGRPTPRAN